LIGAGMSKTSIAKFRIGQVIRHKVSAFRGVVFDVDAEFREFSQATILIEAMQHKDQPFYYLFAENDQTSYIAYIPEQNLLADTSDEPVHHPQIEDIFERDEDGCYRRRDAVLN
jgi:heat shock protein HspQ